MVIDNTIAWMLHREYNYIGPSEFKRGARPVASQKADLACNASLESGLSAHCRLTNHSELSTIATNEGLNELQRRWLIHQLDGRIWPRSLNLS